MFLSRYRGLVAVLSTGLAVLLWVAPADAERKNVDTWGTKTETGGSAEVRVPGSSGPSERRVGGGPTTEGGYVAPPMACTDFAFTGAQDASGTSMGRGAPITDLATLKAGDLVWVECNDPATGALLQSALIVWDPANPAPILLPPAAELGQRALRELVLPVPGVQTWPPAGRVLVGLETWFHVDSFVADERTVAVAGVSSTVHAEPVRAVWHVGETDLTCTTAGMVWSASRTATDCGYTFHQFTGGASPASVDVVYHLTWSSNLGDIGDLGEVTRTTSFALRVWEMQAVLE